MIATLLLYLQEIGVEVAKSNADVRTLTARPEIAVLCTRSENMAKNTSN